jgi:hypothetical protein
VEVRTQYQGHWTRGFEIHDGDEDRGYVLRRRSDRAVLPVRFSVDEVAPRRERDPRRGVAFTMTEPHATTMPGGVMNKREAWTVSIVLRCDDEQTRARVFLQGPPVEMECSSYVPMRMIAPDAADATMVGETLAAARALQNLSQRLYDRAGACRASEPGTDDGP